ncbi:MAG: SRPBCC family protein [Anaerolineales bacterium]|nr:SRPBCC family protein [Anaerolineales bacterium]
MRSFELNIFIDRPYNEVYDHLAEPINMIGLQPYLTTIDILKEQKDSSGVSLRPFYMLETYRWAGLPLFKGKVYTVIQLTNPKKELVIRRYSRGGAQIAYRYEFHEIEDGRTHLVQKTDFEKVNKLFENIVYDRANKTQRGLLTNLKVRLETQ